MMNTDKPCQEPGCYQPIGMPCIRVTGPFWGQVAMNNHVSRD